MITVFGINYCHFAVGSDAIHTRGSLSDITCTCYVGTLTIKKTSAKTPKKLVAQYSHHVKKYIQHLDNCFCPKMTEI